MRWSPKWSSGSSSRVAEFDLACPSSSFRSRSSPSLGGCRVRLAESGFEFPFEIESEFRFHCAWFGFEFGFEPWKMLSECSPNPPGNVPGGSLKMLPGDRPRTPGRDTENDHFGQQAKNHHTVGDSSRKCRVAPIRTHSPSPLKLPPLIP